MKALLAFVALLVGGVLTGCQTSPEPPAPVPQPVMPAPEAEPAPPPPLVPEGPAPGTPAARTQSQQLLRQAAEALNAGNEDKARTEIAEALRLDPESKLGQCLNRGITADPEQALGRQSTSYTVRAGETLGRIAQRALGDACEFYLLARYNKIPVPQQLAGGQVIRIPGRTPLSAPDAPPVKPQPEAATAKPQAEPAAPPAAPVETAAPAPAAPPPAASPSPSPEQLRAQVEKHQRAAQAAFRRQDLATAIREWDQVLALDPANDLARARRQEALELDRRVKQLK
jgi:tetratricopeptide (TPR) repeat protein